MARNQEVDAWLAKYDNPMKDVVQRVRELILEADPRIDECIKWQAPTFTYLGNMASFFPKSRQHASLMFHQGALIPGRHARLEGTAETGRTLKIGSVAEANAARADIARMVKAWCDWREAETGSTVQPSAKKKPTKPARKGPAKEAAGRKAAPAKKATRKASPAKKAAKKELPGTRRSQGR